MLLIQSRLTVQRRRILCIDAFCWGEEGRGLNGFFPLHCPRRICIGANRGAASVHLYVCCVIYDRPISAFRAKCHLNDRQTPRFLSTFLMRPDFHSRVSARTIRFGTSNVGGRGRGRGKREKYPIIRASLTKKITFGRYQSAANEVDLIPHEDHRPRGYMIAPPQGLENFLGGTHRCPIGCGIDDAVCVRLVRRDAIFRLKALIMTQTRQQ